MVARVGEVIDVGEEGVGVVLVVVEGCFEDGEGAWDGFWGDGGGGVAGAIDCECFCWPIYRRGRRSFGHRDCVCRL